MKKFAGLILLFSLLGAQNSLAASPCESGFCELQLEYKTGGQLFVSQGLTLVFGADGQIFLGEAGQLVLTSPSAQLVGPFTASDLQQETYPSESSIIELIGSAEFTFGPGGYIDLGQGGYFEYPDDGSVETLDASLVNVTGDDTSTVNIHKFQSYGTVNIVATSDVTLGINPDHGFGIHDQDTTSIINISGKEIVLPSTLYAGMLDISGSKFTQEGILQVTGALSLTSTGSGSEFNTSTADPCAASADSGLTMSNVRLTTEACLNLINSGSISVDNVALTLPPASITLTENELTIETDSANEETSKEDNGGGSLSLSLLLLLAYRRFARG